jgi:hypothetical protein
MGTIKVMDPLSCSLRSARQLPKKSIPQFADRFDFSFSDFHAIQIKCLSI